MPYTPEEMLHSDTAKKVRAKAVATLRPIQREMGIMAWGPELRSMMWQTILRIALDRMVDAMESERSGGPVSGREPVGAGRDVSSDSGYQRSRPADPL